MPIYRYLYEGSDDSDLYICYYITILLYYYDIEDERHIGMIHIYVIGEDIDMSESC